jgi:hypothetical protein
VALKTMLNELTGKQLAFVVHPEVLTDTRKAYTDAGYADSGSNNCYALRQELLPIIIEEHRKRVEKLGVTWEWLKNEVVILARSNLWDFLEPVEDERGNQFLRLVDIDKWDRKAFRAIVKKIKYETVEVARGDNIEFVTRVSEIEYYDRLRALQQLADLFKYEHEQVKPPPVRDDTSELLEVATTEELEVLADLQAKWAERLVNRNVNSEKDRRAIDVI